MRTALRKSHVSRADLDEALRGTGSEADLSRVRQAYLERDGSISVVPRAGEARVLEVTVADNVQTVRISID
ncbi:YetF domain-containing protein [Micromonospora echinofusca]